MRPPKNYFRLFLYRMCEGDYKKNVVKTSHLEAFVLLCIILNVISMAMAYEGASE